MRRIASVISLLAFAVLPALAAQEVADTLPFRAHQWAFLFTGGSQFIGLGALHFSAPNRALIVNLSIDANHSHQSFSPTPGTTVTSTNTNVALQARIGRRFYQPVRHDVAAYQTIGVLGGANRSCGAPFGGPSVCSVAANAGIFGELGAQYFLTPRLSIGGQVTASLSGQYIHDSATGRAWFISINGGAVSFGGGIYF